MGKFVPPRPAGEIRVVDSGDHPLIITVDSNGNVNLMATMGRADVLAVLKKMVAAYETDLETTGG